jgi:hypothetical protein
VRKWVLAIFLSIAFVMPAASARAQTPREMLEQRGTFWATSVTSAKGGHPIKDARLLWLGFGSAATLNADGGEEDIHPLLVWEHTCNEYSYDVKVTSHRFLLEEAVSTAVGCPGHEDDWLNRFFDASPHWRLHDGSLILTAPAGRIVMHPNPHRDFRDRIQRS